MSRFLIEELQDIEGPRTDTGSLSAAIVRLILSSRRIEARVCYSDAGAGVYAVMLEGTLEIGARGKVASPVVHTVTDAGPAAPPPGAAAFHPANGRAARGRPA